MMSRVYINNNNSHICIAFNTRLLSTLPRLLDSIAYLHMVGPCLSKGSFLSIEVRKNKKSSVYNHFLNSISFRF